jgi:hypothetical protein
MLIKRLRIPKSSKSGLICPSHGFLLAAMAGLFGSSPCWAEHPFFVTYTTQMEEVRTLEIESRNVAGNPKGGNAFVGSLLEFEYGATPWWTTEFYLDGQTTRNESTIFTGYRWENRFRLLPREHWITLVLYVEYENLSLADKTLTEVVGHDVVADLRVPNGKIRAITERELELKLLLTTYHRGWSISENFISEKVLNSSESWQFGYAFGAFRPLGLKAKPNRCSFCPENFLAGAEVYGGLGTARRFGLNRTSHYLGPCLGWDAGHGVFVKISPNFGLTGTSARFLIRFGIAFEFEGFGHSVRNVFRGGY